MYFKIEIPAYNTTNPERQENVDLLEFVIKTRNITLNNQNRPTRKYLKCNLDYILKSETFILISNKLNL
jgi:flagellar basal body-associated protein FliL